LIFVQSGKVCSAVVVGTVAISFAGRLRSVDSNRNVFNGEVGIIVIVFGGHPSRAQRNFATVRIDIDFFAVYNFAFRRNLRDFAVNFCGKIDNVKKFYVARSAAENHSVFKSDVAGVLYAKCGKSVSRTGFPKDVFGSDESSVFLFTKKFKGFTVCVNPLFVFFVPHIKADLQRTRNDFVYAYFCRIGEPRVSAADHKAEAKSDSKYRRNDYVSFCIFHYTFFSF